MKQKDKTSPNPAGKKQARRADALRANLQKRKQQTRARTAEETPENTEKTAPKTVKEKN